MTITTHNKPLQLNVNRRGNAAVVSVVGSVSMSDADRLREALEKLTDERISVIVLDLREMDFICSVGLGAIIVAYLKCRHHAGQIKLVCPVQSVRELLETTRLTKLFRIYDSIDGALAGV